jgi:hypothetical protein
MEQIILSVEGVTIYTFSAFVLLAFLWSGFVFYKKSVEYRENEEVLFNTVLLAGALSFVGARVGFVLSNLDWFANHLIRVLLMGDYPGMSGWGALVGIFLATMIIARKTKGKIFDLLDLVTLGLSAGIPIVYAANGVLSTEQIMVGGVMSSGLIKGLLFSLWFVFLWRLEGEYRTFEWYRFRKTQARAGFVTGGFLFGLGLVNGGMDLLIGEGLSWWQLVLVVAGMMVVYIRSERKLVKDLRLTGKGLRGLSIKRKTLKWPKKKRK